MLILVTGGAASGKSEHAERLVCEKAQSRLYLATMQPFGKSAEARIARHRALRAGKGFATVERTLDLANFRLSRQYDGILLEDLGNLLANLLRCARLRPALANLGMKKPPCRRLVRGFGYKKTALLSLGGLDFQLLADFVQRASVDERLVHGGIDRTYRYLVLVVAE